MKKAMINFLQNSIFTVKKSQCLSFSILPINNIFVFKA